MWALRIMHESRFYDQNSFITLTYNEKNLPPDRSLHLSHIQNFFKRLRTSLNRNVPKWLDTGRTRPNPEYINFKYFYCGEYGEKRTRPIGPFTWEQYLSGGQRPHYHACLLGIDFNDKELFTVRNGIPLYSSAALDSVWQNGFTSVGELTQESAGYVARYTLKKVNGPLRQKPDPTTGLLPYERVCEITGEIREVTPEFAHMSRGGRYGRGIGYTHFINYHDDIYPHDRVITKDGRKFKPPRYYDDLYEQIAPITMEEIRARRADAAESAAWNNTPARLKVRETVKKAQLGKLFRGNPNNETTSI
jgi:hypothetical protein